MPSNKETLFQQHICNFLKKEHKYIALSNEQLKDKDCHIIQEYLMKFIKNTQSEKFAKLAENFGEDAEKEIIKAIKKEVEKIPLWIIIRNGITVKGVKFELYKPKPRSKTSEQQYINYQKNIFSFKDEYYYNKLTKERIDLVIFLNGLPIVVIELKHEDEGQNCSDAITESFLNRDLNNKIYKMPFLYIASSNTEVKTATNPNSENNFRWFNASLLNKAETDGEYPVEHLYRYALAPDNILKYLEFYLVFVPAKVKNSEIISEPFTIFPRYHQLRASKNLSENVKLNFEKNSSLGLKYLINHSAGSGKTLTIAWMSDLLDSLYISKDEKIFNNIVILTDRKSLDKNIKDDLEKFTHLKDKVCFAKKSADLATFLENDRDIIVTTIHKFSYIQEKIKNSDILKTRKIAFLIDEAHRSQEGKMSLTMRKHFTDENEVIELEETAEDAINNAIENINISNQVFVAFTATTTPKTVSYFGEPFDVYSEEEAIEEGYILNVAQNIISYETLYHLKQTKIIPNDLSFPDGVIKKALRNIAFNDDALIQYKSEVIMKLFDEKVKNAILGKGKAMVVTSSRPAGLKYFNTLKEIIKAKKLPYKILFAFSDYTDSETKKLIEEYKVNELDKFHKGMPIEDVFDLDEYRILVVANKFQTGFDQPKLSAMFLDKAVNGITAIQTVSRLNRHCENKKQSDILVVDFTNNSKNIFDAFNKHRKGSPFKEKEPNATILQELYNDIISENIFSNDEIEKYIELYKNAEADAIKRSSSADAILSNLNQDYLSIFKKKLKQINEQKKYIALLIRYKKLFYFISQFYELNITLKNFIIFAENLPNILLKKGKVSELNKLLKTVELNKAAVKLKGNKVNFGSVKSSTKIGLSITKGGNEVTKSTIEQALEDIKEKYDISNEDAIVIKEICKTVSENNEIKNRLSQNKNNKSFIYNYEKDKVVPSIKNEYENRDMWDKLENPIYIENGGIISLMGKSIIKTVTSSEVA